MQFVQGIKKTTHRRASKSWAIMAISEGFEPLVDPPLSTAVCLTSLAQSTAAAGLGPNLMNVAMVLSIAFYSQR